MNTNYNDPAPGFPGMTADSRIDVVETGFAGAAISFGDALVVDGANVIPADDATATFAGVAVFTQTKTTGAGYAVGEPVGCKRQGTIFVTVSEAVAKNDVAYCDVANPGQFCKTATDNLATGGTFRSASVDGVAVLEINIP
jgi:hypothetical protein